jgi:hypothetical protein
MYTILGSSGMSGMTKKTENDWDDLKARTAVKLDDQNDRALIYWWNWWSVAFITNRRIKVDTLLTRSVINTISRIFLKMFVASCKTRLGEWELRGGGRLAFTFRWFVRLRKNELYRITYISVVRNLQITIQLVRENLDCRKSAK